MDCTEDDKKYIYIAWFLVTRGAFFLIWVCNGLEPEDMMVLKCHTTFCATSPSLSTPSSLVSISLTVTMSAQARPRDGLTPFTLSLLSTAAVT